MEGQISLPKMPAKSRLVTGKQAEFCRNLVAGMSQREAYMNAFKSKNLNSAGVNAVKLLKVPHLVKYLTNLREASFTKDALTAAEKRSYLARAVRTPLKDISDKSDLCQEATYETTTDAEGNTTRKVKIKAVNKLQAIEIDSKIAGHNFADQEENRFNPFGYVIGMIDVGLNRLASKGESPVIDVS